MWQPVSQPLPSLTHAHQGPPLTAVHPRGSQETPAEGTRRRCTLRLAVGRGAPAAALAPLLGLWAGWLPQQPVPTPGAHPGLQALPEQQDISWPECPWKEAAYQRGKDTLFRPGHLPRLGVACLGPGGEGRALIAGGSQPAGWGGRSGEGGCASSTLQAVPGPWPFQRCAEAPPSPSQSYLLSMAALPLRVLEGLCIYSIHSFKQCVRVFGRYW